MPPRKTLTVAVAHPPTSPSPSDPLTTLTTLTHRAASLGVHLLLLPAAYLGAPPHTTPSTTTTATQTQRNKYLTAYTSAIDLGDTPAPAGAGIAWIERALQQPPPLPQTQQQQQQQRPRPSRLGSIASLTSDPTTGPATANTNVNANAGINGDGTRETLEDLSRTTNAFLVVGVIERAGRNLFSSVLFVHPECGVVGKRRGVGLSPTDRTLYTPGCPSNLKPVRTKVNGVEVTLGAAIGAENLMPLVRESLYMQGVEVFLALGDPGCEDQDGEGVWEAVVRTISVEGRVVVLGVNGGGMSRTGEGGGVGKKEGRDGGVDGGRRTGGSFGDGVWFGGGGSAIGYGGFGGTTSGDAAVDPICIPPNPRLRKRSVTVEGPHEIVWPEGRGAAEVISAEDGPGPGPGPGPKDELAGSKEEESGAKPQAETEYVSRGSSCIVGPLGEILAGPSCGVSTDGLLVREVDLEDCIRARMDLGSCPGDAFRLTVEKLDLSLSVPCATASRASTYRASSVIRIPPTNSASGFCTAPSTATRTTGPTRTPSCQTAGWSDRSTRYAHLKVSGVRSSTVRATASGQPLAILDAKITLVLTLREFDFVDQYAEWDRLHPSAGPKTVFGERAYQIPQGWLACRVHLRGE
ncbi:carbon-nitrogen hydrolase [Aspergillus ellipticus CBS 707.79]|uniref:Carbon-nitrogen hydrolase n=1 Tax=Aspergillus ellipticus CBS 707.79 TaxID=1448320 RepID=A0A319DF42_9EURO|nr:carbon-nitrogen hydrolase [Aspergillus ellipticus CBS 707.79]